jgi:hypothetical protein
MKLKNLRKKIRQLEKRLREGQTKLVKLKRKLDAKEGAQGRKAGKESAVRVRTIRQTAKSSRGITSKPQTKAAAAKKPSVVKKVRREVNLSPERRAQLAAAMKARWAAKKAAAEASPESAPPDQTSTLEGTSPALDRGHDGA